MDCLQIVEVRGQVASFLIVRGSVPIYWSQPGYKYRPPPVIERGVHQMALYNMSQHLLQVTLKLLLHFVNTLKNYLTIIKSWYVYC